MRVGRYPTAPHLPDPFASFVDFPGSAQTLDQRRVRVHRGFRFIPVAHPTAQRAFRELELAASHVRGDARAVRGGVGSDPRVPHGAFSRSHAVDVP